MNITSVLLAVLFAGATSVAYAADAAKSASPARVSNGWVRAPVPGQRAAGAYLEIASVRNAALVGAATPAAARVEMHETTTEGGVMRMRAVQKIELGAGQTVKLAPNGMHLMLFDLTRPLKVGDKVPLTLSVQEAAGASPATVQVELEVRAIAPSSHHH